MLILNPTFDSCSVLNQNLGNDEPWLFLSRTNHTRVDDEAINLVWKRHFHPKYEEIQQHRAVTSHYGRHRFTTFWRVEEDVNRELTKYMRGDTSAGGITDPAGGIDHSSIVTTKTLSRSIESGFSSYVSETAVGSQCQTTLPQRRVTNIRARGLRSEYD